MNKVFCFLIGVAAAIPPILAFAQRLPTATGDYCYDEVLDYLSVKFALTPSQIRMKRLGGNSWWHIHAWTPLCNSEFVFNGHLVQMYECSNAQYGKRTYFVKSVHATGDCRLYLPREEYLPRFSSQ